MKFAADRALGKLAKWLRMLGYDTLYSNTLSDDEFVELANEGRILLSRNTRMAGKIAEKKLIFVSANDPKTQLHDLIRLLGIRPNPDQFFSRCIICNEPTRPIERGDVVGRIPDHIWTGHNRFSKCQGCERIYWSGSHVERSRKEMRRLLSV